MPVIGIDLGTTYSCVAGVKNGKLETIPNGMGKHTTPSFVAFFSGECSVGRAAQKQSVQNPKCTVFDVKRLMGMAWENTVLQENVKRLSLYCYGKHGNDYIAERMRDTNSI